MLNNTRTEKPLPVSVYLPQEFTQKALDSAFKPFRDEIGRRPPKKENIDCELFAIDLFARLGEMFRAMSNRHNGGGYV